MKKPFIALLLFSFLAGCAKQPNAQPPLVTVIVVTATPEPSDTPMPTLDAAVRATIAAEYAIPTATTRPGFPTPFSSISLNTTVPEVQRSISFRELYIGKYVIRSWGSDSYSPFVTYTISAIGQPEVQIPLTGILPEGGGGLDPLTGIDITGEGEPDAIFHIYTGGNHCCTNVQVYNLGQTIKKVFELGTADCSGTFIDIDNNGIYEYETCDPTFAYTQLPLSGFPCSYAHAPYPKAVFQYSSEHGYKAANLKFANRYKEAIAFHEELVDKYRQNPASAISNAFSICDVSKLVLDYLYSGQTEEAWKVLYQIYPFEVAGQYKAIIEAGLENNVFFDTAG